MLILRRKTLKTYFSLSTHFFCFLSVWLSLHSTIYIQCFPLPKLLSSMLIHMFYQVHDLQCCCLNLFLNLQLCSCFITISLFIMVPSQTCQYMSKFLLSAFPEHLHNLQLTFLTSEFSPLSTVNLLAAEVFIYWFVCFFVFLSFMVPFFISVQINVRSKPDSLTNDPQQILMSGFPKNSKGSV